MTGTTVGQYHGQDYLYYVGCEGSYDTRAQQTARALAKVLQKAGLELKYKSNDFSAQDPYFALLLKKIEGKTLLSVDRLSMLYQYCKSTNELC